MSYALCIKRFVRYSLLLLVVLCTSPAIAGGASDAEASNPAEEQEARDFVSKISDDVLAIVRNSGLSDANKEETLVNMFKQHVDTDWMGQFALGKYFRQANDEQKKRYLGLYHEYLLRSYVPRFREYTGGDFEIQRVNPSGTKAYNVQSLIKGSGGDPDIRVDYTIKKNGVDYFRIVDIKGEGVSLIATQRSDFAGLISRKGFDFFLDKLQEKVNKLHDAIKNSGK